MDIELEDNKQFISNIPRICLFHVKSYKFEKSTRGSWKIFGLFDLSQTLLNVVVFFLFFFFLFIPFKVFPTYIHQYTFVIFCIPSENHEVNLLLRYQFTAEIKTTLVSYLFLANLSFSSENNQKMQRARSGLYGGWDNMGLIWVYKCLTIEGVDKFNCR